MLFFHSWLHFEEGPDRPKVLVVPAILAMPLN